MKNRSCKFKRILAFTIALATLLGCAPALAESYSAIIADASLTVYADAALSKKAGELDGYTLVTVNAEKNGVAQLKYGSYTVYAAADALRAVEDVAIPAIANQDTRVFEAPDLNSRSAAMKAGTQVNVLYISGNVAMIEKGGNLGYTNAGHLTPVSGSGSSEGETGSDPFLPEESAPETSDGSSVTIETFAAQVSAATLPVYKSASTSSKKLGALSQGQSVTVYAYNSDWAYIGLSGKYGFCARAGLTRSSGATQPGADLDSAIAATVTAASVTVYQSASTSSKSLGTLRKGAEVNVVETSQSWAYIELNGKYGYCALDALTKTSDLNAEDKNDADSGEVIGDKNPLGTATVIQATAPVYDSMSASSPKGTLKLGETVSFYGYDSKWVLIGKNGTFGFMPRQYLSADSYAELKEEDSGAAVKELEAALLALGYLDGAPSVNYSSLTTAAVQRFQAACSMTESGVADLATLRVLYSGNAPYSPMLSLSLSSGAKNDNVNRLQTRLYALGYLSRASSIDGDYGANTAAAVRLFQSAAGITATGTADSATIRALYRADAPTLASGTDAADASSSSSSSGSGSSGNTTGMPSNLASTTSEYKSGMSNAQKLEYVIYVAQQQLGKRYVFGSAGTATFDCSGLTMYCFKQVGVSLRHSAYSEGYNDSYKKISDKSSLRRGDLVFFNTVSDGDQCDHVGIYLGSYYFIHASSGAGKVIVSNLSSGYYSRVFSWGRRILET